MTLLDSRGVHYVSQKEGAGSSSQRSPFTTPSPPNPTLGTPSPNYNPSRMTARNSLETTSESITEIRDNISRPYALRPNPPVRRKSRRAVGRPSPLVLTRARSRSRQNLKAAYLTSPPPPTPPIKRRPPVPETPRYTLELNLPDGPSHFMTSPRMQGLVTRSYAERSTRSVSRRKSNTSMRSSASDRFKNPPPKEDPPPIPTLPHISDLNHVEKSNVSERAEPQVTMSTTASVLPESIDPQAVSPTPKRAKESRYHRNAPPPLQLKSSAHRRPSISKRSSRRISRDTRASMQSIDTSLFPLSPLTPRPRMPSKKELQRRRLLKLKRTLGEDVPLELITPPPSSGFRAMVMRDLGASVVNPIGDDERLRRPGIGGSALHVPLNTNTKTTKGAFAAMRKKKVAPLGSAAHLAAPAAAFEPIQVSVDKEVVSELPPRAPTPPVILISAHPYANILPQSVPIYGYEEEKLHVRPDLFPSEVKMKKIRASASQNSEESSRSHWPRTPFARVFEPVPEGYLAPPLPSTVNVDYRGGLGLGIAVSTVKRSERRQGWSGEWNQPDMQDVIAKLRNM
ncbi:hypothetical protein BDN70DRAFT_377944 [Pholiota conissans]|uniref:Uncharacterized protein n=1 Tax=Pholiota conissans TaxID=109636 RepID=A0A9P5YRT9_9AGAR|nr:hypothetical protein BDN70DRAFT_377944 [Pholiota conissans]